MKTKSFFTALMLFCATCLWASDTGVDGIWYDFDNNTMTAKVTFRGFSYSSYSNEYSGSVVIPASVTYNDQTYSVTSIGTYAFYGCNDLTAITISENIKGISDQAFRGCSSLTSVVWNAKNCADFRDSNYTPFYYHDYGYDIFYDLTGQITSFVFGDEVEHIPAYLCGMMKNLTSVTIPNSVTSIGYGAFNACTSLTSVTIPNSVTSIGDWAFAYCSGLTSITIGNGVTSIGVGSFEGCTSLTSITIPNNVTSIRDWAFRSTSGLTSITIGNGVTSIGVGSFEGCTSLTSVYCESATPATIQSNTFPTSAIFYVPNCAYTAFHNAPTWKDFNIVPVDVNLAVMNNTGGVVVENCGQMEIEAIPYIGYQFKRWQDGNKENPRKYTLSQTNRNFIAEFELKKHQITLTCDASQGSITGDKGKFNFDTEHEIEAVPNYGYHFTQWSDGETENPRTFVLEQDTTFTALFAPNKYSLAIQYNDTYGEVEGEEGEFDYLSEHTITVNAKYGYHLDAWSDGVTDNPRTLVLTMDTTITAIFAPNKYSLELIADANLGEIEGEQGAFDYLSEHEIQAVPKTGCVFNGWSDGVTANPRTIILTQDTSITALFEKHVHEVTVLCNDAQGVVVISGETYHSAECTITATPNYGYHFVQWNDGVTENPRTFVVTQDTTFTAEFAVDRTGTCGTDMALTWTYNPEEKVLTISGTGAFNDNMQCGIEARTALTKVEFAEGVTAIGTSAFANCETLQTLVLRKDVKKINENAFYNCENLTTIYNYRSTPANVLSTAFDGVDKFECVLYVPQASLDLYKNASVWRDFYYTQALPETPTGVKDTQSDQVQCTKVVRDGQILILRGDKTYTLTGQAVK